MREFAAQVLLFAAILSAGASCTSSSNGHGSPEQRAEFPGFLTPVAIAESAGVDIFWMGTEFDGGSLAFELTAGSELINRTGRGPGLEITYVGGSLDEGGVAFDVESYTKESGEAAAAREQAEAVRGASSHEVAVGPWPATVFTLPGGNRPVNALWMFVDVGETIVLIQSQAGTTGIPGTDFNPLIQEDLLIEVVEEHLRPYPE